MTPPPPPPRSSSVPAIPYPRHHLAFASFFAVLLCSGAPLAAQQRADTIVVRGTHAVPVPSAQAVQKLGKITIDGRLDDEAWSRATPITDFTQVDPKEGE